MRKHQLLKEASRDMQREGLEVPGTFLMAVAGVTLVAGCVGIAALG